METFSIALLKLFLAALMVVGIGLGAMGLIQGNYLAPLGFVLFFTSLLGCVPFIAEFSE